MAISGNLKTMELAELLQWLASARKTGTLVVDDGRVEKKIVFKAGRILSSSSTNPNEHLGAFLVSHGLITEAELGHAIQLQKANKKLLGRILVDLRAVSEADLRRLLRLKAEESIYDVFSWREGEFHFVDGEMPPPETIVPVSLDVAAIVLEGMQRLDDWRRIREAIPSFLAVPVRIAPFDESEMSEVDGHVLATIDDDRSLAEICTALHAGEFQVGRIVLRQVNAGRLKLVRPRPVAAPPPEAAPPTPPAISGELLLDEARQRLAKGDLPAALRHARAAKALEPENRKLDAATAKIEEAIRAELDKTPMKPNEIPKLARTLEELSKLKLTAQEGFLLSRIDGIQNVGSLLKLGPLGPLDTQLILRGLIAAGHVRLDAKR
jgi:hypothetical protein